MADFSHYRAVATRGGRMPFNAAAVLLMLDEIDRLQRIESAARALVDEWPNVYAEDCADRTVRSLIDALVLAVQGGPTDD